MSPVEQGFRRPHELSNAPRLLVIDDDLVQRVIICKVGQTVGYECVPAASFHEALYLVQREVFDCITLDLSLGEHSGTQLLRNVAEGCKAPVVIISGCGERVVNSTVRLATALGLKSRQIPKPLDLNALQAALQENWPEQVRSKYPADQAAGVHVEELVGALRQGQIVPWFQPKVEFNSGRIVGCEALARWPHPARGFIAPAVFIPMAETAGLMPLLTSSLTEAAIRAVRPIVEKQPDFSVAVNFSASLLSDLSLGDEITRILATNGMPAHALTVEITESMAMSDIAKATDILLGLRVIGVGVSIDDFGTGHASLAALARMPFNELKIDRLFVQESADDRDMARAVRACVQLGHEFEMRVVAEGIETSEDWRRMQAAGCDIGQGLGIAPALDIDALQGWMSRRVGSELPGPMRDLASNADPVGGIALERRRFIS